MIFWSLKHRSSNSFRNCSLSLSLVAKSCPTLVTPWICSLPGSSVHGILQARILELVAIFFTTGSSRPRDQTQVSCTAGRFFTDWAVREAQELLYYIFNFHGELEMTLMNEKMELKRDYVLLLSKEPSAFFSNKLFPLFLHVVGTFS